MTGRGRGRRAGARRSRAARGAWAGRAAARVTPHHGHSARSSPRRRRASPSGSSVLFSRPGSAARGRPSLRRLRSRRGPAGARRGSPPGDAASLAAGPLPRTPRAAPGSRGGGSRRPRAPRSGGRTGAPHAPVRSARRPGPARRDVRASGASRRVPSGPRGSGGWGAWCAAGGKRRDHHLPLPEWERRAVWVAASCDIAPWSRCGQPLRGVRGGKGAPG